MKFAIFGNERRLGLLEDERLLDLGRAADRLGAGGNIRHAFSSLQALIESGRRGLDAVLDMAGKLRDDGSPGMWVDLGSVNLHAPWPGQRFLLAGSNNPFHIAEAFTHMGSPLSVEEAYERARRAIPSSFWGQARPVMGPGEDIRIPQRANGYFDYEAEPAIILGTQGKDIKAGSLADHVWGVTLVNDWSIRLPEWPPKPNPPFMAVKNFDASKSIGPCIVVDEIDPDDFMLETLVNGKLRQKFSSSEMIYSFGEILEFFSQDFTFLPGDVISGGTGQGTVIDQLSPNGDGSWPLDPFLKPGDRVEVRSDAIGSLINTVVA